MTPTTEQVQIVERKFKGEFIRKHLGGLSHATYNKFKVGNYIRHQELIMERWNKLVEAVG
jgi:hypothetical protein